MDTLISGIVGFCGKVFSMNAVRRKFSPEYRANAARLVIDTGRPVAHVAAELGLGAQLLGRWVAAERSRESGTGGQEKTGDGAELARLRKENAQLRMDNEFLGKAAAFFASKHPKGNASN